MSDTPLTPKRPRPLENMNEGPAIEGPAIQDEKGDGTQPGFRLLPSAPKGELYTSIDGKTLKVDLSAPTQEQLKALYDKGPEFAAFIAPPDGYTAAWPGE